MSTKLMVHLSFIARSSRLWPIKWRPFVAPGLLVFLGLGFALIPLANGEMFFYWDNAQQHYAQTAFLHEALKSGAIPHWWTQVGSGVPTVAEGQSAYYHPIRLLLAFLLAPPAALMTEIGIYLAVAGLSTYFFLREFRLLRSACFIGGLCQMFGSFSIVFIRNMALHRSFCLLPLAMLLAERFVTSRKLAYGLATSVLLGLQLLTGHPTFAIVTVVATTVYVVCRILQRSWSSNGPLPLVVRELRNGTITWWFAVLLGVGIGAIQFFPQLLHIEQSIRQGGLKIEYATSLSAQLRYLPQLIFPYVYLQGDWIKEPYSWGSIFNVVPSSSIYLGALPAILVIFALWWYRKWPDPGWSLAICFLVALALALGDKTPFFPALWSLPGLNGLRYPHRFLLWASFCLACLSALGLNRVISRGRLGPLKKRDQAFFLALFGGVVMLGLFFWTQENVVARYVNIAPDFRVGLITCLALLFASFVLVGGLLTVRRSYHGLIVAGLVCFVFLDLWLFRMRSGYAPTFPIQEVLAPPPVVDFLKKDRDQFRVMSLIPDGSGKNRNEDLSEFLQADTAAIWGIDSTDVWFSLFPRRYYALREGIVWELLNSPDAALKLAPLLGALNVKYVVAPLRLVLDGWTKVYTSSRAALWKNPKFLPRNFMVGMGVSENLRFREEWFQRSVNRLELYYDMASNWWFRQEDAQIVDTILAHPIDFQTTAVMPKNELLRLSGVETEYEIHPGPLRTDTMSFTVKADRPALLVISNSFYPGWTADVNGKRESVLRVNYVGMGVVVPSGKSEVVLRFVTPGFRWGAVVSGIALSVSMAGLLVPRIRRMCWAPLGQRDVI